MRLNVESSVRRALISSETQHGLETLAEPEEGNRCGRVHLEGELLVNLSVDGPRLVQVEAFTEGGRWDMGEGGSGRLVG